MRQIYWANSLFTEAQRAFNIEWVSLLRSHGYVVFLPQEIATNDPDYNPESWEIFHADTTELLDSDLLVAVVDDETIDSGVATEIGLAYAAGIPVVGVYTDLRRNRKFGRMYKNLYVLGLLESSLGVVHSKEELLARLASHAESASVSETIEVSDLYSSNRLVQLDEVVGRLESSYVPRWSSYDSVISLMERETDSRLVDFGCGTGKLAQRMAERVMQNQYLGYDIDSGRVHKARGRGLDSSRYIFTDDFAELIGVVRRISSTRTLNASFVLHDLADLTDLQALSACLSGSHAIIHDLAADDLPRLTRTISLALGALPHSRLERRFSISRLSTVCERLGLNIHSLEPIKLKVVFETPSDVLITVMSSDSYRGPTSRFL